MSQDGEQVIRKGSFHEVTFSSAKKLVCGEGELILTPERLSICCKGFWSKSFSIRDIFLEAREMNLEVYDFWYRRLTFRLIVDDAEEWERTFQKMASEHSLEWQKEFWERQRKKPEELNKLFEMKPEIIGKIFAEMKRERLEFGEKNIGFILDIERLIETTKSRKLKAFILAHCYIAWYEWTKNLLYKIYKGKFGKGPKDDEELIEFLESFPSLGVLDTRQWRINANQIRNCVAHERFYYDYKRSELVFMVKKEYRRIRVRELRWRFFSIAHTYETLIQSLIQKAKTGKISYENELS